MNEINIKILSEDGLIYFKKNVDKIVKLIQDNDTNEWIYTTFPTNLFIEKKYTIEDFELKNNPESKDKSIDLENSIKIFNHLKKLPRYILTNECFWLWLHLEKFYKIVKNMMPINSTSTILDHWMHKQGTRRGLMFGVLSRCYFRVELSIDDSLEDKYELTKWIIDKPERFRNLTWRSFSSELHLVRGIIKGEKKAVSLKPEKEKSSMYPEITKYICSEGSVKLLDVISEEDIEEMVYRKALELLA